jgi:hypothetical protein
MPMPAGPLWIKPILLGGRAGRSTIAAAFRLTEQRNRDKLICPSGNSHMTGMRKLPVVLLCRSISVLPKAPHQRHIPGHPAST